MYFSAANELPATRAGVLLICGRCHALRGPLPGRNDGAEQLCLCAPREMRAAQPKRGDHDTDMELCYCCGLTLLRSGSKWSLWLCAPCKQWVAALNQSAGRCLVPIGRHSIMNGVSLTGNASPQAIDLFTRNLNALSTSMDQFASYARDEVVLHNLNAVGFPPREHVSLAAYLQAVEEAKLTPWAAFERLLRWLDIPDALGAWTARADLAPE